MSLNFMGGLVAGMLAIVAIALLIPACTNLWWMLHAWRTPETHEDICRPTPPGQLTASFSMIVPIRHEQERVVRATVARLLDQRHDDIEVVIAVGDDDLESVRIGEALAAEHPGLVLVAIDQNPVKNKPKQLNTALRMCTKDFVTIFDAESLTHPELLAHADGLLAQSGCSVLQSGVQLVNHRTTWFSLRNCLEYFFWFRSRLHLHAQHGFIPLGGNTVFVRRDLLVEFGGWDEAMLTEDCDLGVRLSSHGIKVAVSYDPRLVTREETPDNVGSLIRQRSRWNQGFLQVLHKGDWQRLPSRRQRLLARYTLVTPYLSALTAIALPIAILAALLAKPPMLITMLAFLPLIPTIATLLFECAALREFGRSLALPIGLRDYVKVIVTLVPYQAVLGYAALRAVARERRGNNEWEKTAHSGAHLAPLASSAVAR